MIDQSAHKPSLVLMAGLPGRGKTSLAARLGAFLRWPTVNRDLLKASLIDAGIGLPEDEVGRIAYELSFTQVEHLLVHQRLSLIFDTSARHSFILENVRRIVRTVYAELKIIYCAAPSHVRLARLNARAETGLYHSFNLQMHTTVIKNDFEHLRHLGDRFVVIDTQRSLNVCLQEALAYILQNKRVSNE